MVVLIAALTLQAAASPVQGDVRLTGGGAVRFTEEGATLVWEKGGYGMLRVPLGSGAVQLLPEVGASVNYTQRSDQDLYLVGGLGLGGGDGEALLGLVPSLSYKVPRWGAGQGRGLRLTVLAEVVHVLGVQLSYQTVWVEGEGPQSQVMLTGSLNGLLAEALLHGR